MRTGPFGVLHTLACLLPFVVIPLLVVLGPPSLNSNRPLSASPAYVAEPSSPKTALEPIPQAVARATGLPLPTQPEPTAANRASQLASASAPAAGATGNKNGWVPARAQPTSRSTKVDADEPSSNDARAGAAAIRPATLDPPLAENGLYPLGASISLAANRGATVVPQNSEVQVSEPASPPLTLSDAQAQLVELGAQHYRLETWGEPNQFRFSCSVPRGDNSHVNRHFEARAEEAMQAVGRVLADIRRWRSETPAPPNHSAGPAD